MFTIKTIDATYKELVKRLDSDSYFYFNRFGDGDCTLAKGVQQYPVGNNKMTPSPQFAKEMVEVLSLEDDNFMKAFTIRGIDTDELWFDEGGFGNIDIDFINSFGSKEYYNFRVFMFYFLHRPEEFEKFIREYMRPRKIMYVGGNRRDSIEKIYGKLGVYIQTPLQNSNMYLEDIWKQVFEEVDKVDLILPSAGATSKIISKRLFKEGVEVVSLDMGSIHDGYDGRLSRTWLRDDSDKVQDFLKRF